MGILQGQKNHHGRWWGNLSLTLQSKWCRLWNCLTKHGRWWYLSVLWSRMTRRESWRDSGIILHTLLNWNLLGLLPIHHPTKTSYGLLDWSHSSNELINYNLLRIHICLIWLVWHSDQSTSNFNPRSWTHIECINIPTIVEILDKIQCNGNSIRNVYQLCWKVTLELRLISNSKQI